MNQDIYDELEDQEEEGKEIEKSYPRSKIPPEDRTLVGRLRDPSTARQAFGEVIRLYTEPLYWQIRRMVQNHDDANDLLQNTFIKAWTSIENFRGNAKLSTWLYKIAINESLTFLDKENRRKTVSIDGEEATPILNAIESDKNIDGDRVKLELRKAIAALPEKQRLVFNMRYYDEIPYEKMSKILGTSEGALKASYHLAVKKIQQHFDQIDEFD